MKISGSEVLRVVFDMLEDCGHIKSALKVSRGLIHGYEYIVLGIGDDEWHIEECLDKFGNEGMLKPSSNMCVRYYINKEYDIEEEKYSQIYEEIYG